VTISYVRAGSALNSESQWRPPVETLFEFLQGWKDKFTSVIKSAGKIVTGATAVDVALVDVGIPMWGELYYDPTGLIDQDMVDVLLDTPPEPAKDVLIVRGIENGIYDGQEVRLCWPQNQTCVDSVAIFGPDVDTRFKVEWMIRDGLPLPTRIASSSGLPGDREREAWVAHIDYRKDGDFWLAVRLRHEDPSGTQIGIEVVEIELNIKLDDVDWSDEVKYIDRDKLIRARKEEDEAKERRLRELYEKSKN
jgi:hypothetical protein